MQIPGSAFADNKNIRSILDFIARRELQPGQRLPSERELVRLLGIGRNSLREAMKVLEAMGILDIRHGSGIFLRKAGFQPGQDAAIWLVVHKDEICNALTVREALDLRAIDLIPPEAYPAVERRLRESLDVWKDGPPSGQALLDHDLEFHNIVRRASGNELLLNICVALTGNFYDERRVLFGRPDRVELSLREHDQIARAFAAGDAALVKQAYAAHLASTRASIQAAYPAPAENG